MQSPSKLKTDTAPLFLDASVVINLVASNYTEGILLALDRPMLVTEDVCAEFKRHPRDGGSSRQVIENLTNRRRVQITKMSDSQFDVFLRLTGYPPPDDLGDGEAATLACADGIGSAVIDDRKALRIATRDFPNQTLYSSLDLFCAEQVLSGLGRSVIAQAVYDSIKIARMRVPSDWRGWVSNLLGKARVAELPTMAASADLSTKAVGKPDRNRGTKS
jgi:predicted nucleic acid-binding protein